MTRARSLLFLLGSLQLAGCSLNLDRADEGDGTESAPQNSCTSSSECGDGECWEGLCVAHEGDLSSILVEVAPPKSAAGVGGGRFLQTLDNLGRSIDGKNIDLQPSTTVRGFFVASDKQCGSGPRSFAVDVIFTPREEGYGLFTVSTRATSTRVSVASVGDCGASLPAGLTEVDQFTATVPNGAYDVYVQPVVTTDDAPSCDVVPQLFRKVTFAPLKDSCLILPWTPPTRLNVAVPWPAVAAGAGSLDGWSLQVVHPVTGRVLSNTEVLAASDRQSAPALTGYVHTIPFAPVTGDEPGKELVRLSPPADVTGPVIQADRSGLQTASAVATFPSFWPLPAPVAIDWWVYADQGSSSDAPIPVSGTVSFVASSLVGVKSGIFASYSTKAVVGSSGTLRAQLLPGKYRTRIVPDVGMGYGATESQEEISCTAESCIPKGGDAVPTQAGRVLKVKSSVSLTGSVLNLVGGGRASDVSIDAVPAAIGSRNCTGSASDSGCTQAPLGVLDVSLGNDAFVPRSVTTIARGGTFTLESLDCGACTDDSGALFDIVARPADHSRLAWSVRPGVTVSSSYDIGTLALPLPIVQRGKVEIPQPTSDPVAVADAFIKAYVLLDQNGEVILDPRSLSSCSAAATQAGSATASPRCIRSTVQVAETSANGEGDFELVLPSSIERSPQ